MKRYLLIILILVSAGSLMAQSHVSDLVVTPASGGTLKWYNASTGGTQYTTPTTTDLVNGTTYYASQTVNGIESATRLAVTAHLNPSPSFTIQPGAAAVAGTDVTYTTESGKSSYVWGGLGTLNTDYSITSGGTGSTDNTVTLKWLTPGSKTVTINYTAYGCTALSATSATTTTVHAIGEAFGGGKIAYIDGTGLHGLIAATADQSTGIAWWNGTNTTTGATATALGSGSANTTAIISSQENTGSYAAKLCRDYTGGGYEDWYLPSKDELNIVWINRVAISGFELDDYWSSTEGDDAKAFVQYFSGSYTSYVLDKNSLRRVRAIRSF